MGHTCCKCSSICSRLPSLSRKQYLILLCALGVSSGTLTRLDRANSIAYFAPEVWPFEHFDRLGKMLSGLGFGPGGPIPTRHAALLPLHLTRRLIGCRIGETKRGHIAPLTQSMSSSCAHRFEAFLPPPRFC